MDLPATVLVHNTTIGMKGEEGTLLQIADRFYEVNISFGSSTHRVMLPIDQTVIIFKDAEEDFVPDIEIER